MPSRPRRISPAIRVCATAGVLTATSALACGYHDPSSVALGMLNLAYPESLHVRTAVWTAQLDGTIARSEPLTVGGASPDDPFRRMLRLREALSRLDVLRGMIEAAADGAPSPAFSVVLIGPLLWSRFEAQHGALALSAHTAGPASDDVVVVTDDSVVAALVEGRISPPQARRHGLVRMYGNADGVARIEALFDRVQPRPLEQMTRSNPIEKEN